jgi:hypothetical protein
VNFDLGAPRDLQAAFLAAVAIWTSWEAKLHRQRLGAKKATWVVHSPPGSTNSGVSEEAIVVKENVPDAPEGGGRQSYSLHVQRCCHSLLKFVVCGRVPGETLSAMPHAWRSKLRTQAAQQAVQRLRLRCCCDVGTVVV